MTAIAPVPPGTPRHPNLGETSSPKPVYSRGMALPSANASVVTTIVLGAFSALALIWFGTFAMLASHPAAVLQLSARSRFPRPAKLEDVPPDAPVSLDDSSLATLVDRLSHARVVLLGEASHGTHEYYAWRARITLELLAHHDFSFVAVEGDWPDCMAIDRFVKLDRDVPDEADEALRVFLRWPTWMWANEEVSELLGAIRALNGPRRPEDRAGFYGLDVYSLWESLERVLAFADHLGPEAAQAARDAFACFEPYGREPQAYARATMMVPADCKAEAERMLVETLRARGDLRGIDARLDAEQNARVVAGAERYYRAMVRGDAQSWNVRDVHMADTLDRLLEHHGARAAKAIVWAHNTHVGDARATDMASEGMLNLGQLARE